MSNPFGKIEFSAKDLSTPALRYDRLAVQGSTILMLSIVAEGNFVKAVRACLNGSAGGNLRITASDGRVGIPNLPHAIPRNPGDLVPTETNYLTYIHKLDYGLSHALFVTKKPGFLPVSQDESLWRELMDTRYTTPLLREWLPYVKRELIDRKQLKYAESFGCQSAILSATDANLDEIVSDGLGRGEISIPR